MVGCKVRVRRGRAEGGLRTARGLGGSFHPL